jgi:hypothetical protein
MIHEYEIQIGSMPEPVRLQFGAHLNLFVGEETDLIERLFSALFRTNPSGLALWRWPETYRHPRRIRELAKTAVIPTEQLFVSTHSLFLMRELYICQHRAEWAWDVRCFNVFPDRILQGASIDDVGDVGALDEELRQSERYLDLEAELSRRHYGA